MRGSQRSVFAVLDAAPPAGMRKARDHVGSFLAASTVSDRHVIVM
jgi:hypothetical protein